mgnify:CR=1 FL=1
MKQIAQIFITFLFLTGTAFSESPKTIPLELIISLPEGTQLNHLAESTWTIKYVKDGDDKYKGKINSLSTDIYLPLDNDLGASIVVFTRIFYCGLEKNSPCTIKNLNQEVILDKSGQKTYVEFNLKAL